MGEGAWACRHCHNVNYRHREVCNTRKCAQPRYSADSCLFAHPEGSWLCVQCGNVNYAHRTTCHTRKCAAPHPNASSMIKLHTMQALPVHGMLAMPQVQRSPSPPRSWPSGGGVAPGRMSVRPDKVQPLQLGSSPCLSGGGKFVQPVPINTPRLGGNGVQTVAINTPRVGSCGSMVSVPPGSWECPGCSNINYPMRSACNRCQMRKPEGSLGDFYRVPSSQSMGVAVPPDSWTCVNCGNVNYGFRIFCNTRKCRAPKPGTGDDECEYECE